MTAALVCEVVMTFMFLFILLGATDKRAPAGFAPIAMGLGLTLVILARSYRRSGFGWHGFSLVRERVSAAAALS